MSPGEPELPGFLRLEARKDEWLVTIALAEGEMTCSRNYRFTVKPTDEELRELASSADDESYWWERGDSEGIQHAANTHAAVLARIRAREAG